MRLSSAPGALLILLAGCGADQVDSEPPTIGSVPEVPAPGEGVVDPWAITPMGAGPLRIGMTLSELSPHLAAGVDSASLPGECDYVRAATAPDSVLFMVERGRLVRIDVTGGAAATPEGARVGDLESRIVELYPTARRGPHKYTDGAYLTVLSPEEGDTLPRYVFETDGQRVTRYRAGVTPAVEYVEGCA